MRKSLSSSRDGVAFAIAPKRPSGDDIAYPENLGFIIRMRLDALRDEVLVALGRPGEAAKVHGFFVLSAETRQRLRLSSPDAPKDLFGEQWLPGVEDGYFVFSVSP